MSQLCETMDFRHKILKTKVGVESTCLGISYIWMELLPGLIQDYFLSGAGGVGGC